MFSWNKNISIKNNIKSLDTDINEKFEKYLENSIVNKSKLIETLIKKHLKDEGIIE